MTVGPLTHSPPPPTSHLLGPVERAAEWVAYVGLRGRYAIVPHAGMWRRWDGRCWVKADRRDVVAAIRLAIEAAYVELSRCGCEYEPALRLLDVNWRLDSLLPAVRRAVTVPPERLGL